MNKQTLRVHGMTESSRVNGPGTRAVIWAQGCSHGCVGCFNPFSHDPTTGDLVTIDSLLSWVGSLRFGGHITGLTISGGEPMQQAVALAELLEAVRSSMPANNAQPAKNVRLAVHLA